MPVCFVSAEGGAGVAEFLQIIARLMPNPAEGNPPPFLKGYRRRRRCEWRWRPIRSSTSSRTCSRWASTLSSASSACCACTRARCGSGSQLFVGDARKPVQGRHLFKLMGKDTIEIERAPMPGDICAIAKVDEMHLDAVLHDSHDEDQYSPEAAELPAADARPRDRAAAPRRRAALCGHAAQAHRRRPVLRASSTTRPSTRPCSTAWASSTCGCCSSA